MIRVRTLGPGDEARVGEFLDRHADASMFLRSNLAAAGLVDEGRPLQATWAGAFDGDALVAVAAHAWNGNVLVQAPRALPEVVRHAVAATRRPIDGALGEWTQVLATRSALGLDGRTERFLSHDDLFALDLTHLVVPAPLAQRRVRVRVADEADRERIVRWRSAYRVELLGHPADDPHVDASSDEEMAPLLAQRDCFLLEADGAPVSFCAYNAKLPDCVQIGGVYTPPALRGRGYARAVVAASLLAARDAGVTRSILFTGQEHEAARRAYLALGYEVIGEFGIVFFADVDPSPRG
jgi:RimJ/RimL family protein N-acetyltransferase